MVAPPVPTVQRKIFIRIGRPGYRVTKIRDPEMHTEGLLVQVHLPQVKEGVVPRKRFMSAFEQKKEAPNKNYQYLIVRPALRVECGRSGLTNLVSRLLQSLTKQLLSGYPPGRSKTRPMTMRGGTGSTGTLTPSNSASSSCSGSRIPTRVPNLVCILRFSPHYSLMSVFTPSRRSRELFTTV